MQGANEHKGNHWFLLGKVVPGLILFDARFKSSLARPKINKSTQEPLSLQDPSSIRVTAFFTLISSVTLVYGPLVAAVLAVSGRVIDCTYDLLRLALVEQHREPENELPAV